MPPEPRPVRGALVSAALLLAGVLFVLAVSILCYRWIIDREPSSIIVLNGSDALEGVVAQVSGVGMAQPIRAKFEPQENYILRFHVEPGNYTLSLIRDDKILSQQDFTIPTRHVLTLDLWRIYPSTRPTSAPSGESDSDP
jgi:hypothetical protein